MLAALATVAVLQADPSPSATPSYSYEQCIDAPGVWRYGCPIPAPNITFIGNGQLFVSGPITERLQFTEYQNGHAAGTHNEILVRDYKSGGYVNLVTPCGGSTYYVYTGPYSVTPPETYLLTGHDAPTYYGCPEVPYPGATATPPATAQVSATTTPSAPANTQQAPTSGPAAIPTTPLAIGTAETITAASASSELPFTGDATEILLTFAGGMCGGGALCLVLSRRRY